MPRERVILCGNATAARTNLADGNPLRLVITNGQGGIHLKIQDIHETMVRDIPSAFLDLIEVAAYVSTADKATHRADGGRLDSHGEELEIGRGWRRSFHFHIPVRDPDLWSSPEIQ